MYTLRKITKSGTEMHLSLGSSYNFVDGVKAPQDFAQTLKELGYGPNVDSDSYIYAFVSDEGGRNVYPLFRGQAAFIMTESGKTFANVSEY